MTTADVARSTIVVFVVLAVQQTLLDSVRVAGAHPDIMLLLPVSAGYIAGPERGATFGFATGLVADLFLPTTFGLSALVGCLLGYSVGLVTSGLVRSSWWMPPIVAAAATAAGLSAYAILGALLGEPQQVTVFLAPAVSVATPAAAILAIPVLRFVAWAVPPSTPDVAQLGGTR
jgi:rod shape-determining protein MreD